jgi:sulfatase modifying factor 1
VTEPFATNRPRWSPTAFALLALAACGGSSSGVGGSGSSSGTSGNLSTGTVSGTTAGASRGTGAAVATGSGAGSGSLSGAGTGSTLGTGSGVGAGGGSAGSGGSGSGGTGSSGMSGSSSPDAGVDAAVAVPPSCAPPGGPGMTNCGSPSESCCTSLEVTGGTYERTYANAGGGPTGPEADPATVSGFRLDKYLVTVGRFRQFVNAWNGGAGYTPAAGSGI